MATVLEIVQKFCRRTGLPRPNTVFGSTNAQVLQAMALLEEAGADMAQRGPWRQLNRECTWTTTATEDQGNINDLADNGFQYILWHTLWDRTEMLPLLGPLDAADWQFFKAINVTGPRFSFRIRANQFLVIPAPPAGSTWVFEYISRNWIFGTDDDPPAFKEYATRNTDEVLLPEELLIKALRWVWKKEKGLDYAEDFSSYERAVTNYFGRHKPMPDLHMDDRTNNGPQPGIWVPYGSWPV